MNDIIALIKPRILSAKNRTFSTAGNSGIGKIAIFGSIGILFWSGIFYVSLRVLGYFKSIEQLGDILAFKLLSMMLVTVFSLLVFSNILTSLSKLFLSRDIPLVHSMPVASYKIFIARFLESTFDSSWMVITYTLPVFISYGIIYETGLFFYGITALSLCCISLTASAISSLLVMIAVIIVPATRMRTIFLFLGFSLFLILYLAFRLLRPERLVDPEIFATTLVYLKSLRTPSSLFLPSTWAFDSLKAAIYGLPGQAVFHLSISLTGTAVIVILSIIIADAIYFKGISKSDTAQMRLIKASPSRVRMFGFLPGPVRAFVVKDIKTFFRDQTQWSQVFLIGALIVIYIYNFSVLPLEKSPIKTVYLQNLLAFLNMGLASFVLTAIAARFAYPAVSIEGAAFWLAKSGPIPKRTILWIKFFIYFFPLLVLSEILVVATNILLHVTPFMMILSPVTVFCVVPGVVSMGIGLGAAYPDFKAENPIQTITSFGGFLFMVLSAGFIGVVIALEAGPVYDIFMSGIRGEGLTFLEWIWTIASFSLAFGICVLAVIWPIKFGEKRLVDMPA